MINRLPRLGPLLAAILCLALPRTTHSLPEGIPCPAEPTDMAIGYGDVITCQLESAGDSDIFRFLGTAGEKVMLFVTGTARPCLEVIKPDNARQTACDVSLSNRIDLAIDQTGSHAIRITGILASSYTLVLERVVPASRDRIAIKYGDLLQGDLDPAGEFDLFVFRGSVGDTITIDASGVVRPCIELVAPDDSRQKACAVALSQRIDTVLALGGTYAILYSGILGGTYVLSVQCLVGPCVPAPAACTTNAECDDGNACTVDACSPADPAADALGCLRIAIPPSACDDADACTTDACDPGTGCIHTRVSGCNVTPLECAGQPDLTPCGAPAGNCRLACRSGQCASELLCQQTSASPAARGAARISVVCETTGAGANEFCEAQGFAEKPPGQNVRPAVPVPAGLRKVTNKVRREIDPASGQASLKLPLNDYGKRLLRKARARRRTLSVTLVIERGTDTESSLLTQTVILDPRRR